MEFNNLKKRAKLFIFQKKSGRQTHYLAVFADHISAYVFTERKVGGKQFTTVTETPITSCGIEFDKVARRDSESAPVLFGSLHHPQEQAFSKTSIELSKFLVTEGRVLCSETQLRNSINALISHARQRCPESIALPRIGVFNQSGKLVWFDFSNAIILASHPAAVVVNKQIATRFQRAADESSRKAYFDVLHRFNAGFPIEWQANLLMRLGHALGAQFAPTIKDLSFSFGEMVEQGVNRTVKTPRLQVASSMLSDGELHTSAEIDTRFKQQTMLSRPGLFAIDETLNDRNRELSKAMATSNVSAARGQADGTMVQTPLVATPGIATNRPVIQDDDPGAGELARTLMLHAPESNTQPSPTYAEDYAFLRGPTAPQIGRWFIDEAIHEINDAGIDAWASHMRACAARLEKHLKFSKRSETFAISAWFAGLIADRVGIDSSERLLSYALRNALQADADMDEVQNLICFIRQCEIEVLVFFNEEGQFYRGKDNTVYLTQATVEKWQRSRGLKVTKQALKDTVRRLQLAGLEIEEPASKRFDDEVVWAAATKLKRITTTYDEPLTTNYTELTEIYRHKNNIKKENVSAKQSVTP